MFKEIDDRIGISKYRYKLLFLMENSFGVFRLKESSDSIDSNDSTNYDCLTYSSHDCVYPTEVLTDLIFRLRSGEKIPLLPGDIIAVCVNGLLYSYRFYGVLSWKPEHVLENFEDLGTSFFLEEKSQLVERLHRNEMVLDVLGGRVISLRENPDIEKYSFYGIEKETYPFRFSTLISEYSIYKLKNDRITNVNPTGSAFYDIRNALYFYLKKYQSGKLSVLLYDRKELEMIKDYFDVGMVKAYGA